MTNDPSSETDNLSKAVRALFDAHQNVANAEARLNEASDKRLPTAEPQKTLDAAKRQLDEEQKRLDSLYQSATIKNRQKPFQDWAIAALLTLLALLAWTIWWTYASITEPLRTVLISASAVLSCLALLAVVFVLQRLQSRKSLPAVRDLSASDVPIDKLQDAAKRVADATEKVETAENKVDSAESAANQAAPAAKAAAQKTVAEEKKKLAKARDLLQFEQKLLDQMLGGQSLFLKSGNLQFLVFGALSLIVLCSLMYGIFGHSLLPSLASVTVSRGLITFLIAMVTVTIALILVLATVVSESSDRDQRFTQGKEILTMLIGVLGTIVGFYFGNVTDIKGLQIETPFVSNESPTVGEEIDISSSISGGKAPFTIDLVFIPSDDKNLPIESPKEIQSPDGAFKFHVKTTKATSSPVSYQIKAHDSDGRSAIYDSALHGGHIDVKPAGK